MRFAGSNPQLSAFISESPQYDQIGNTAQDAQSAKRQTAVATEAETAGAGLNAMANVEKAKFDAEATRAMGMANAASTQWQGFGNMMGSIAGGIGKMDFGSKDAFMGNPGSVGVTGFGNTPNKQVSFGYNGGEFNGFGTFGPNWGY